MSLGGSLTRSLCVRRMGYGFCRCDDCCKLLHYQAGWMDADARHSWAMANVYQAKELW
jgi:hypothetical protein